MLRDGLIRLGLGRKRRGASADPSADNEQSKERKARIEGVLWDTRRLIDASKRLLSKGRL